VLWTYTSGGAATYAGGARQLTQSKYAATYTSGARLLTQYYASFTSRRYRSQQQLPHTPLSGSCSAVSSKPCQESVDPPGIQPTVRCSSSRGLPRLPSAAIQELLKPRYTGNRPRSVFFCCLRGGLFGRVSRGVAGRSLVYPFSSSCPSQRVRNPERSS
jgi:hypothetical protein